VSIVNTKDLAGWAASIVAHARGKLVARSAVALAAADETGLAVERRATSTT